MTEPSLPERRPTAAITSAANPLVKRFRQLADRKYRRRQGAFVVEGRQPVWRAVEAGWEIEALIAAPDLLAGSAAAAMVAEQEARGLRVAYVSAELFGRIGSREGPSGIAAIVRGQVASLDDLAAGPGTVFTALHRIGNPGNLGTIIRTVDATGGAGVITVGGSTDPFAPAAVKASMGSLFAVPVAHAPDPDAFYGWAAAHGVEVIATSGSADTEHWHATYRPPLAVLFGAEGTGLPGPVLRRADRRVRIPMTGTAESLNLAAAVAVMLYEISRPAYEPPPG
ncbi:MAG: TrmH family RNA methyltransferase [Streptosporangiaceae bacterium]